MAHCDWDVTFAMQNSDKDRLGPDKVSADPGVDQTGLGLSGGVTHSDSPQPAGKPSGGEEKEDTVVDRLIARLKNHPVVAVLIVTCTIVMAIGSLNDAIVSIAGTLGKLFPAEKTETPIAADSALDLMPASEATVSLPAMATASCSEPSQDAMNEVADSIGKPLASLKPEAQRLQRTQNVQLLRDAAYRFCEALVNGAITSSQYAALSNTLRRATHVLLIAEQSVVPWTPAIPPESVGWKVIVGELIKRGQSLATLQSQRETLQDVCVRAISGNSDRRNTEEACRRTDDLSRQAERKTGEVIGLVMLLGKQAE